MLVVDMVNYLTNYVVGGGFLISSIVCTDILYI